MLRKTIRFLDKGVDRVVVIISLIFFLICFYAMYDAVMVYYNANDTSVLKYKPHGKEDAAILRELSEDAVAWLTIDDTNIDYPIMQGRDNAEYLNKNPYGDYSLSGSIFLDSRSSPDFSDEYSVIYGHHMDYGKMFGALDDFLNESYLKTHSTGTLMVGRNAEKVYKLEVFASARVSAREKIVFDMQNDRIRQYISDNADILTAENESRILALSTCADADSVTRIVVFCYIIE